MKKLGIVIVSLVVLYIVWTNFTPKFVSGRVIDAETGKGIDGVTVEALQTGWGWDGYIVWDKTYPYTTTTDNEGNFKLKYTHGDATSVHLRFSKDYYISTKPGYPLQDIYVDFWEKPVVELTKSIQ